MDYSSKFFTKKNILENFPVKTLLAVIAIWIFLAVLNFLSLKFWKFTGCDLLFPFSVLYPNNFLWTGILSGFAFLFLGFYAFKNSEDFGVPVIFLLCIILVLLGNLAQGNLDIAFEQPFYLKGRQYYHDALPITDIKDWIRNFNRNQDIFQLHTRTHPPFVVALHYGILKLFNGSILALGITFFLMNGFFFPILNSILKNLDFNTERRKELLLLSAIIPSVNIYLLVSIDGIILMTSSLVLLGITGILRYEKIRVGDFLLIVLGVLFTNLLSFSGLFLFAFLGIFSLVKAYGKNFRWLIITAVVFAIYVLSFVLIYKIASYNHLLAFRHASASENPGGFMLLSQPYIYFWTRLEDISEILFQISLAFTAVVFSRRYNKELWLQKPNFISFSAFIALGLMFITGAYGTGETARACLFIVPFFLIMLRDLNSKTFKILYFLTLLQVFGMQLIGNFFW